MHQDSALQGLGLYTPQETGVPSSSSSTQDIDDDLMPDKEQAKVSW